MNESLFEAMRNGALLLAFVQLVFNIATLPEVLKVLNRFSDLLVLLVMHVYLLVKYAAIGALLGLLWYVVFGSRQ